MPIFEVVDSAGATIIINAQTHNVGSDEHGRERHDFIGGSLVNPSGALGGFEMRREAGKPFELSFTAPRSVREVPS